MRKLIDYFTHSDKKLRDNRWIFASMLVGSILSLIASFVLSVEALELAKNPDAILYFVVAIIRQLVVVTSLPLEAFYYPG